MIRPGSIEVELRELLGERLKIDEPMDRHTTIGAGGKAAYLALPRSAAEVAALIMAAYSFSMNYLVVGRGSNLLVRDGGYDGLVIKIGENMSRMGSRGERVWAQAGCSLSTLARRASAQGRGGLEFALGIPGSGGGAVRMNAGAFGGEIADVLVKVALVDERGKLKELGRERLDFGYRTSRLPAGAVVSATFWAPRGKLDRGKLAATEGRRNTQPVGEKSFGSTFINPPGHRAAELIERCGLKGKRIGGAMISPKHANFIVNPEGRATAAEVESLIELAERAVRERFGVELMTEVVIVGEK